MPTATLSMETTGVIGDLLQAGEKTLALRQTFKIIDWSDCWLMCPTAAEFVVPYRTDPTPSCRTILLRNARSPGGENSSGGLACLG
jgi:hypothetical protein